MQHVEALLVLEFEVDVGARDQHVDDVVAAACHGIMQRRVALHVLHNQSTTDVASYSPIPSRSLAINSHSFLEDSALEAFA